MALGWLVMSAAWATGTLELAADRPLLFYVDGRLAAATGLKSARVHHLAAGTHRIRLAAVGGRTVAEAEVDVPDGVVTRVAWEEGVFELRPTVDEMDAVLSVAEPSEPAVLPVARIDATAAAAAALSPAVTQPVELLVPEGTDVALRVNGQRLVVSGVDGMIRVRSDSGSAVAFGPEGPRLIATIAVSSSGEPVVVTVNGVLEAVLREGDLDAEIDLPPGTHLVELLDPNDGTVRNRGLVDLDAGEWFALNTGVGAGAPHWRPL